MGVLYTVTPPTEEVAERLGDLGEEEPDEIEPCSL